MNNPRLFIISVLTLSLLSVPAKADYPDDVFNYHFGKTNWEIIFGYVNKSWVCTYPSAGTQREDFFGDPDGKFLHGVQIGALYTPSLDCGLGLRTGLFFEGYLSESKWIREYCHHFAEADLYIPLHASYHIPFSETVGLNIFGGMGFQWAMSGKYFRQVGTAWYLWRRPIPVFSEMNHQYGNGWPQKANWQLECGVNLHYRILSIGFTYSFGIVDHGIQTSFDGGTSYVTASRSRQDKMQVSIAFAF